mgnify:CR=1 FL=1
MRHNEWRYSIKTGLQGLGRHPLLSIAAITTLALMLFLMSAFVAFSLNANHLSEVASQQPPIEISMRIGAEKTELDSVEDYLKNSELVQMYEARTPLENYDQFKQEMQKDELWKDFDYKTYIPHTFNVRLADPAAGDAFRQAIADFPGVHEVMMESELMSFLDGVKRWTARVGIIVFIVLALISTLVMANTVRIAALSRSREINIMKYVGATNTYIRIPFVVEGAVIGLVGALLASFTAALIYSEVVKRWSPGLTTAVSTSRYAFLPGGQVTFIVFVINLLIGLTLCTLISAISVRKYAKV